MSTVDLATLAKSKTVRWITGGGGVAGLLAAFGIAHSSLLAEVRGYRKDTDTKIAEIQKVLEVRILATEMANARQDTEAAAQGQALKGIERNLNSIDDRLGDIQRLLMERKP